MLEYRITAELKIYDLSSNDSVSDRVNLKAYNIFYLLPLEHNNWISIQVGEINALSTFDDFRALLAAEPAHVGEEEAPLRIVRVCVSVRVFVVGAVVAGPLEYAVLVQENYVIRKCLKGVQYLVHKKD